MSLPQRRTCGTMILHEKLMETSLTYRQNRLNIENASRDFETRAIEIENVITIPVVVHVVYNIDIQNISDAQIESQIRILNEDFRMKNADISSVPQPFKDFVADPKIEFQLAVRDPDGKPTNGITRTFTRERAFNPDEDNVKFNSTGGKDAWPTDKYLNMWVCNLSNSILGYAQFPGGPAETDGVVILYTAFGDIGTATEPFNKGRTATHEVGHWLNLRHIWGDDWPGSCIGSDEIDDTPNQADANFGRPTFPRITCNNAPNGDMFMNYYGLRR
ncbi:zinc metalloprotease [Fischerella sp. PCC 9605]|uniref:zinc metalloprotease n=1 Tax=Fischerella sp. PCC 9605 TaxID=1173024 RepID=UPI0018CC195A|nr:zinc metalloprotease [Fischerella sp. PCC 9605]